MGLDNSRKKIYSKLLEKKQMLILEIEKFTMTCFVKMWGPIAAVAQNDNDDKATGKNS